MRRWEVLRLFCRRGRYPGASAAGRRALLHSSSSSSSIPPGGAAWGKERRDMGTVSFGLLSVTADFSPHPNSFQWLLLCFTPTTTTLGIFLSGASCAWACFCTRGGEKERGRFCYVFFSPWSDCESAARNCLSFSRIIIQSVYLSLSSFLVALVLSVLSLVSVRSARIVIFVYFCLFSTVLVLFSTVWFCFGVLSCLSVCQFVMSDVSSICQSQPSL